jgi:hypothetical protein
MVDSITEPQTLEGALQVWCEPSLVAEMLELKGQGCDCPIFIIGALETEFERKQGRYQSLRKQLEDEILEKLRVGELSATGYDSRAPIDAPPVAIPAARWRILRADFKESSAASGNILIQGIQVSRPSSQAPAPRLAVPRLRIIVAAHEAQLDGVVLNLTHRSFRLLVIYD